MIREWKQLHERRGTAEDRQMPAPGPETVDEDWQWSKDSADAVTAIVGRQSENKKQNQHCNRISPGTGKLKSEC